MDPYFNNAELYIAPIFDGAGMKVKVAEALSYALPVVGTSHAFEGYAIQNGSNSYIVDTIETLKEVYLITIILMKSSVIICGFPLYNCFNHITA